MNFSDLFKRLSISRSILGLLGVVLTTFSAAAQSATQSMGQSDGAEIEMATGLRADGMIWVVVGVLLIVLFGFLLFLWRLERRMDRLENELPGR